MGEFVRFPGKLENVCFQVLGKPEKVAPGAGSPTSVSQISPSRARSEKKYSGGPRRLWWPTGGVWTRPNVLLGPRARGGGISHWVGGARAWRDFLRISQHPKTRVFQFSPKPVKVLPPLYMRAAPLQKPSELFARETRNKTHHGPPVAPPASAWCVLFHFSRARKTVAYLKFAVRMYSGGRSLAVFWVRDTFFPTTRYF